MTAQMDADRTMLDYFVARSTSTRPDGLLEAALTVVGQTRQRPAWRTLDWWLPSAWADLGAWYGRRVAIVAVVGLLIAVLLSLVVLGGSGHRLPPPFGLAKPGAIAMDIGGDIYLADANGGNRTKLFAGPHWDGHAMFSPDGTKIVFESGQDDNSTALMVMRADGTGTTTLISRMAEDDTVISWSSDSRWIATAARPMDEVSVPSGSHVPGVDVRIIVGDVERGTASIVGGSELFGHDPRWSPDGTMLAFGRNYRCCSGPPDSLWLMRPDGTELRQLSSLPGGGVPAWSPDGRRIAFLAEGIDRDSDLYLVDVDGNDVQKITDTPLDESFPVWSPDGTKIAFLTNQNPYGIKAEMEILDVSDGRVTTLQGPFVTANPPVWSPDGSHILGYVWGTPDDPGSVQSQDALAIFDATNGSEAVDIPIAGLYDSSWQRLAP